MSSKNNSIAEGSTEIRLAGLMRDIHQMTLTYLTQNLAEYGLYVGQPRILQMISSHPGETQRQIADRLYVSGASLSTSLKRLSKAGLIEQRQSQADGRRYELYLTPEGVVAEGRCRSDLEALYGKITVGMQQAELAGLINSLEQMHDNLLQLPQSGCENTQKLEQR